MESDFNIALSSRDIADYYSTRRLLYCPPHFVIVESHEKSIEEAVNWIYNNTEGRFACFYRFAKSNNVIIQSAACGFELEQDALLYTLSFT